jgi:hypothetical protein
VHAAVEQALAEIDRRGGKNGACAKNKGNGYKQE